MNKIFHFLLISILLSFFVLGVFSVYAQSIGRDDSNVPQCQILWWYDNSHQYCQQKEFCGAYMYQGLNTFQTKTECEEDLNLVQCAAEGKTIPVIANPPECCSGLKLIKPKLENQLGIYGYCTAKCGNGICESETESSYNCPEDCTVTCNSCSDCTSKLNGAKSGAVVKLANDIEGDDVYPDQWGMEYYRCISWTGSNSNVTFDCDGHKIEGTRKDSEGGDSVGSGIYITSDYNTIRNCKILDYGEGIYVVANNNLIEGNNFTFSDFDKNWNGFVRGILYVGDNNVISDNTFESIPWGIQGRGTNNVIENNNFTKVAQGISLIEYADGHNNTIRSNRLSRCAKGIYLQDTQDNIISDNDISLGGVGIRLIGWYSKDGASSNEINNNIINNNDIGIYIGNVAKNNILDSNTVCYSEKYEDIKNMKIENNNSGHNNTCDKISNWSDEGVENGCMFKCPILQSGESPSYIGSHEFVLEEPKQKIEKKAEPEINLIRSKGKIEVYEIINNEKLWIPTAEAFNNTGYKWTDIQDKTETEVNNYPRLKLARIKGDTKVYYLTEDGQKRWIPNPEIFNSYGNKWEDVVELRQSNLDIYEDTAIIRLENGIKVYKLENNKKRWIETMEVFNKLGLDWNKIAPVNQTELDYYVEGAEIK